MSDHENVEVEPLSDDDLHSVAGGFAIGTASGGTCETNAGSTCITASGGVCMTSAGATCTSPPVITPGTPGGAT